MKATSVIVLGRASGPRVTPGPQAQPPLAGTTNDIGGIPIKVADQIIGAVPKQMIQSKFEKHATVVQGVERGA